MIQKYVVGLGINLNYKLYLEWYEKLKKMNVRSLIEELQELDPELEVYFDTRSDYDFDIADLVIEKTIDIADGTVSKVALIMNESQFECFGD